MAQAGSVNIQDYLILVKVLHFIDGVKLWNFLVNLDFDRKLLLQGRPLPTWPCLVYMATRLASISCAVSFVVGLNTANRIDCQAWISTAFAFPLIELELSMLLIVLRVVAIWKRSNLIILLCSMTLSMHAIVSVYLLSQIRSFLDHGPDYHGCVIFAPRGSLLAMSIGTIVAYAILLVAMLTGLLRERQRPSFGIWPLLYQQGWIWFALAVAAEVPTLALVLADVDRSIHLLLQVPRAVVADLGATTMYRIIYNFPQRQSRLSRPGEAMPLKTDATMMTSNASLPRPLTDNDLKVSVTSATVQFSDVDTQVP